MKAALVALALVLSSFSLSAGASTQKTILLTGFSASKSSLNARQQTQLTSFADIQIVEEISCIGFVKAKAKASDRSLALSRAKAACSFVSKMHPFANTAFKAEAARKASDLGKVRVTLSVVPDEVVTIQPIPVDPFETPFPSSFTKTEIINRALAQVKAYVQAQTRSTEISLVYQDTIPQSERTWMNGLVSFLKTSFPADNPAFVPVIIVASTDEFIVAEAKKRNLQYYEPGFCGRITTYENYCASLGWAGLNYKDSIEKKIPINESPRRSVLAHEFFHVWHKSIDGSTSGNNKDPRSPEGMPLWFMEGNANFFGFALTHHSGFANYTQGRETQVDAYMRQNTDPLSSHIGWSDNNPYGIGQASAEYLVASVGVAKVLDVYRKLGKGMLFADAFESSIGISVAEYYKKFEAARASFTK
ncbi:MAG: hypothetical protein EBS38_04780 [Actinobacteria bacterium]|nr:hypothetical protein [Actinomycetota bacterium]